LQAFVASAKETHLIFRKINPGSKYCMGTK